MQTSYDVMFAPGKINGLTLKNRIIFPPMANNFDHANGETAEQTTAFYSRLARGGCALVITNTMFTQSLKPNMRPTFQSLALHQKPMTVAPDRIDMKKQLSRVAWAFMDPVPALNPRIFHMVEAVHNSGGAICAALSPNPLGWVLANYDINDVEYQGLGIFNKMRTDDVEETIQEFATVSGELKNVGFDAIEINMSYFPDYFAHASFNKRTDKYGPESWETRLRYHKELLAATRAEVGRDYPLMIIIDADHYGAKGWRTLDETKFVARRFEEWGGDSIRCRGGGSVKVQYDIVPQYLPKGVNIALAAGVKEAVRIPVVVSSKMGDPDLAASVLAEGKADFVSVGRAQIADPDWANKAKAGQAGRIRKCLSCNVGCFGNLTLIPRRPSRCTVNPRYGHESHLPDYVQPALVKRKVVVVGGGPGGMSAALTAAQRGHSVVLFEKSNELGGGGHFKQAVIPPFKEENLYVPEYYRNEFGRCKNVQVRLNTEATADMVLEEKPDSVIIATGGGALVPGIPGADGPGVLTYEDVLLERKPVTGHVVIVGGGSIGSEVGLLLIMKKGFKVTILDQLYRIADNVEIATRNCLIEELTRGGAQMVAGATVTGIRDGVVTYLKDGKETTVKGDTIVIAVGSRANDALYRELSKRFVNLFVIGDARQPRQIMHAVSEGFFAAHYVDNAV